MHLDTRILQNDSTCIKMQGGSFIWTDMGQQKKHHSVLKFGHIHIRSRKHILSYITVTVGPRQNIQFQRHPESQTCQNRQIKSPAADSPGPSDPRYDNQFSAGWIYRPRSCRLLTGSSAFRKQGVACCAMDPMDPGVGHLMAPE